jgi:hypothetical protein
MASQRSLDQNARMWAMLTDIAAQLPWQDWQRREIRMSKDEWKDFLTATFKREQRMVMGEDGASFVLVGSRTRTMGVSEMADFLTFIEAFGLQRGVAFGEPKQLEAARR